MARVEARIDGTPNELRQLIGQPDLLPLYEAAALALERWLVHQVAALDPSHEEAAGSGHGDQARRRARSRARRRIGTGRAD